MSWFLLALGLVLIVEGLAYALAPSLIPRLLEMLAALGEGTIRQVGILALVSGLILVWAAWQFGI
ncbi:MAG: DUF2065 domain-containing protein [Pseudomonadota bacterium]